MPASCLIFTVHQPFRLKHYSFFDIGGQSVYEDDVRTFEALDHAVTELYLPAFRTLHSGITASDQTFRFALALSGVFLEQCERFRPDVLDSIRGLAATGCVELLNMPYYHSLASVFSPQEFTEQAMLHVEQLKRVAGVSPTAFLNTGLIYSDATARDLQSLGYQALLAGADGLLSGTRTPHAAYRPTRHSGTMRVLVVPDRNPDTAIPLRSRGSLSCLTLPLDPSRPPPGGGTDWTRYLEQLPSQLLSGKNRSCLTPTEAATLHKPAVSLSAPKACSGVAPYDLTPWSGNEMQKDALDALYLLESQVKATHDPVLIRTWRVLQDADHFNAMSTHPRPTLATATGTPYDTYINLMNIITDFTERVAALN